MVPSNPVSPSPNSTAPDSSAPDPTLKAAPTAGNSYREPPLIILPFPERNASFATDDGVIVQTYDWGGEGPPLIFAHATGLHAHVWLPLVQRMRSSFHCYGIDARAQGDTTAPAGAQELVDQNTADQEVANSASETQNPAPESPSRTSGFAWDNITNEYTKAMDIWKLSGRGDVYGFGHSQGGFALLSAALARPGTFAHIFGFEPVIFLAPENAVVGNPMDNFMASIARKRREVFASKQEAYENYRTKLPFKMADDDVTRSYVHWGFEDLPDGSVRLKCRAAWEGELFSLSMSNLYHRLPTLDCEVTLGLGEFTSPAFIESIPMQHAQMPHSSIMHFPGRSHFGPLENTDEMATVIRTTFLGS